MTLIRSLFSCRRHPSHSCARIGMFVLLLALVVASPRSARSQGKSNAHANVVGTAAANCKQCHPSEVAQWEKSTHYLSIERLVFTGNSKKYADALQIPAAQLRKNSVCADCHGTKAERDGDVTVISGVSCESCHGPSKEWLKPHGSYTDGMTFKSLEGLRTARTAETKAHKEQRIAATEKAGMIRPASIQSLSKNCLSCHIVGNEKLIAAGHKSASAFDLVSWSGGEVRHNFFMDAKKNAAAPSLWMADLKRSAPQRDRIKFVVGTMVQIEMALRTRATAKNPAIIPQMGAAVLALNGKLTQINAAAGTAETQAVAAMIPPLLGTIFAGLPTDQKTYGAVADKVAEQTKKFLESNDGSKLAGLDAFIKSVPPHYSQQYKTKYQK